jgi:hypothetical protein
LTDEEFAAKKEQILGIGAAAVCRPRDHPKRPSARFEMIHLKSDRDR